jgi:hypothetical protein
VQILKSSVEQRSQFLGVLPDVIEEFDCRIPEVSQCRMILVVQNFLLEELPGSLDQIQW